MARLLLIEDDTAVRGVLAKMLEGGGHEVTGAGDGTDALALIKESTFDCAIVDILLPDMDGIQLLRELRLRNMPLKVVAISGGGRGAAGEYLEMATILGAAETLQKPITADQLLGAVARVLGTL